MRWLDKNTAAEEEGCLVRVSARSFEALKRTFESELTAEERFVFETVMAQRVSDFPSYLSMQIAAARAGYSVEEVRELTDRLLSEFGNRVLNNPLQ